MKKGLLTLDIIGNLRKVQGMCPVCGKPFEYNPRTGRVGQWAHFLCNTKPHLQRYGKDIIESKYNGIRVCALGCNNAVQLNYKSQPVFCDHLADEIKEKNMKDKNNSDEYRYVNYG